MFRNILTGIFCLLAVQLLAQIDIVETEATIKQLIKDEHYGSAKEKVYELLNSPDTKPGSYNEGIGIYLLGQIQYKQLDYLNSIENNFKSREIFLAHDSVRKALDADYRLFNIYLKEAENDLALEICEDAVLLAIDLGDSVQVARWYNSLGNSHIRKEEYQEVIQVERKCLAHSRPIGAHIYSSYALSTIGEAHYYLGELDSALMYMQEALSIKEEFGFPSAWLKAKIGRVFIAQGKASQAVKICEEGYKASLKESDYRPKMFCCECLNEAYSETGNFAKAYRYLTELNEIKAESSSDAKKNDIARLNYEIQYQQQAIADSVAYVKEKQISESALQLKDEKLAHEKSVQVYLFIGLGLLVLFGGFMINRFQVIKKQKTLIAAKKEEADRLRLESEHHRLIAEEKNGEILDSINYAKRIQSAILPPMSFVKEALKDFFIIYRPKDIVAGDFYWVRQEHGRTYFAAADCTGHGVPGAMVSVICNNALNRSVSEFGLKAPGEILNKTREIITEELAKGENEVADGMDIALCCLEGSTLEYAGAHNPLWISRNGEMITARGDKQPVGKYFDPKPFTTHTHQVQKDDVIYVFSDGFQDQFGGEKGKKYKVKTFMNLLLGFSGKSMEEQSKLIDAAFVEWKGSFEQLDDVCVIGVRV